MSLEEQNIVKDKDEKLKVLVGTVLKIGVWTSIVLALIGFSIFFTTQGNGYGSAEQFKTFTPEPFSWSSFFQGLLKFHYSSYILLGILVLILTPILRVLFAVIGYKIEGDKLYVRIGIAVLCIIFASIIYGSLIS